MDLDVVRNWPIFKDAGVFQQSLYQDSDIIEIVWFSSNLESILFWFSLNTNQVVCDNLAKNEFFFQNVQVTQNFLLIDVSALTNALFLFFWSVLTCKYVALHSYWVKKYYN